MDETAIALKYERKNDDEKNWLISRKEIIIER